MRGSTSFAGDLSRPFDAVRKHYARSVRGRAGARRRSRQPGLHRRRRRSRDAATSGPLGFHQPKTGGGDHPRLAFRPPRARCAARARASADRADAGAARSLRRLRRSRRGACRLRHALARMPARSSCLSILRSNAAGARIVRRSARQRAPRLARSSRLRPHVLDAAIDPARGEDSGTSLDETRWPHGSTLLSPGADARGRARTAPATSPPRRCS